MLDFSNLGFFYRANQWIVRSVSGGVPAGRSLAILGPNGRGKTTLLRLLLGTLEPSEGHVDRAGATALVPQQYNTTFSFTALEMVLMGRARKVPLLSQPNRHDTELAKAALERFGIGHLSYRGFDELSGGEKQLVMLARAVAGEPSLVFLDEPTAALDLANQAMLLHWIKRLTVTQATVIFTTHDPHHALVAADDVILLQSASEAQFGKASEMLTDENLTRLYGHPVVRTKVHAGDRDSDAIVPVFES